MSRHFSPHSIGTKVTDSTLVWAQLRSAHHPMPKEKDKQTKGSVDTGHAAFSFYGKNVE